MIKWCLGIWLDLDTQYICIDKKSNSYYLSPFLEDALLFPKIQKGTPKGAVWLPVFDGRDLIEE